MGKGERKPDPTASNTIKQILDAASNNVAFLDEVGPTLTIVGSVKAWLNCPSILNN